MRQASWEDLFREGEAKVVKPPFWSKLAIFSWEELVTLAIVMVGFLTVVQSMSSANWVNDMPSLYPIAFLGLAVGLVMSRLKFNEILTHLIALTIGLVGVSLSRYKHVWAAAGHSHTVFRTTYEELLRVTGGHAIEVA